MHVPNTTQYIAVRNGIAIVSMQKRYLPEIYGKPIYPLLKPWSKKEESRKLCVPTTVSKVSHVVVVIVYCTIFSVRNGDLMDLSYPTAVQLVIFILKAITKHTQLKKQLQLQL